MNRLAIATSFIAGLGLAGLLGGGKDFLASADTKEAYVSTAARKVLFNEALHGIDSRQVTIDEYSLPGGWVGGRHYHTGPVYVYILEGSFTVDEDGKPRQTFKTGALYSEPIGVPMQARNSSATEATRLLVVQVTPKGESLMYKVE
jgi:quercetin dioxygenase-like cupin family protein